MGLRADWTGDFQRGDLGVDDLGVETVCELSTGCGIIERWANPYSIASSLIRACSRNLVTTRSPNMQSCGLFLTNKWAFLAARNRHALE